MAPSRKGEERKFVAGGEEVRERCYESTLAPNLNRTSGTLSVPSQALRRTLIRLLEDSGERETRLAIPAKDFLLGASLSAGLDVQG
jgi:hypothetical protein